MPEEGEILGDGADGWTENGRLYMHCDYLYINMLLCISVCILLLNPFQGIVNLNNLHNKMLIL